ncbi:hypothetical protein GLOIN_2v1763199 [Rhizophagus irregularis DAOM 181602=DAOM 197198]|uniref:Uncharacterized protein n=3 Tax=Rhizophagus irregularis TaxID=588596 RepID=A0A015JPR3_RHIIW|nr:hypothetical protein GLOIN_2v1763199 [Rhizophagus irregularis DAOM 181602=DAOM 197198]EXX56994.1 hypothetical protein RirG_211210 [Rhizophagus irregularis DAOM 197198w]POG81609.1 hypothetical protein GLOIN_2v1763199 [Rhizophagus irregularis DAOM 181602=DAOM 197198]|eukprot:XP_025188475.1 hypothetical protein GLOIN_2v1763199 [Rhizophagus irregularis DAOM 181602=DAOM 197198]
MSFLALPAIFLLVILTIFMGIVNMWMILKQKISDKLFTRDIKINTSITAEITKIKNEINTKIGNELSTRDIKIANELSAHLSEINTTFTVELGRINNDLNNKLTAEIGNFKTRDVMLATPQKRKKYWKDLITLKKPAIMILDSALKKIRSDLDSQI